MKIFDKITYIILGIAMTLIMLHLVYVHAELLDHLNPYSTNFIRSVVFSIAYSFLTLTVIALLQSEKWNIIFAFADALSVALYYLAPLFLKGTFDWYVLIQSVLYSSLTGIATYTLGSLSVKYFSAKQLKGSIINREETLKRRLEVLSNSLDTVSKDKVSLKDELRKANLSINDLESTIKLLEESNEMFKQYEVYYLKHQKKVAKLKKDFDLVLELDKKINELEKQEAA